MKPKYFKLLIFFTFVFLLFTSPWANHLQAQTQLSIRLITGSGTPFTGQAANIKFKAYPYSGGYMTITVTEKGTQGNYICTGFTTFQLVKFYLSDVEQQWFGEQYSGDPGSSFVDQTTNESIGGTKTFTGTTYITAGVLNGNLFANSNRITSLADPVNAQDAATRAWVVANFMGNPPIPFDSMYLRLDGALPMSGELNMGSLRITSLANPVNAQDAATRSWVVANFMGITPITFDSMFVIRDTEYLLIQSLRLTWRDCSIMTLARQCHGYITMVRRVRQIDGLYS
jgi:hypothetical protein